MRPQFSILLSTHDRTHLLKQSIQAVLDQTYGNLELIILENGATYETRMIVNKFEVDDRVKVLCFRENHFHLQDPHQMVQVCFNAGLKAARGKYIYYQSDDNLMAPDYVEKMVGLFKGNRACTTAAGRPVAINGNGDRMENKYPLYNYRARYMPGHLLALTVSHGSSPYFSSPGTIFSIKKDVLVKAGGYHKSLEYSHIYGIVPFGVTGFDNTAEFYWRYHEGQVNRTLAGGGWLGIREGESLIRDWQIEDKWKVFGKRHARQIMKGIQHEAGFSAARWVVNNIRCFRFKGAFRILRDAWSNPWFWWSVPRFVPWFIREVWDFILKQVRGKA